MTLFETIKSNIKEDASKDEDLLEIIEDTDEKISVYDNFDGYGREYTITNPEIINETWIKEKIIITKSVPETGYNINTNILTKWLVQNVDKFMYLTLENIVFMADSEKDFDELPLIDNKFSDLLEVNNLPNEDLIGLMWYHYQIVFVNIKAIIDTTKEMLETGDIYEWEERDTINSGILSTLIHEIRHLAQANPYLPDAILNQNTDDELDAENYAKDICEGTLSFILI